jgi:hypothetical protein
MVATMEVADGEMSTLQTDFDGDGTIDEVRTSAGDLMMVEAPVENVDTIARTTSQSSATRVKDRSPAPTVLGVSVSADTLTPEQFELLQILLTDVQNILQVNDLTAAQLTVLSSVLSESLLIINN